MGLEKKEIKGLEEKIKNHYNNAAEAKRLGAKTKIELSPEYRMKFAKRIVDEHILQKLREGNGFTFLDVGSGGTGALYDALKNALAEALKGERPKKPIQYVFVDISEGQIENLKEKIRREATEENLLIPLPTKKDIRNLGAIGEFFKGKIDFIFVGEVLCHLFTPEDRKKALEELAKVAKKDGRLEIMLQTSASEREPSIFTTMTVFPVLLTDPKEIQKMGEEAGFKHIETKRTSHEMQYVLKFRRKPSE